jgi:hypothetical protein
MMADEGPEPSGIKREKKSNEKIYSNIYDDGHDGDGAARYD